MRSVVKDVRKGDARGGGGRREIDTETEDGGVPGKAQRCQGDVAAREQVSVGRKK